MKNIMLAGLGIILLIGGPLLAAKKSVRGLDRFYGNITAIERAEKQITVFNRKRNQEKTFKWADETQVFFKKKAIPVANIEEGQPVIVYYDGKRTNQPVQRITIRKTPKKTEPNTFI